MANSVASIPTQTTLELVDIGGLIDVNHPVFELQSNACSFDDFRAVGE
jgi:hypothetical protein